MRERVTKVVIFKLVDIRKSHTHVRLCISKEIQSRRPLTHTSASLVVSSLPHTLQSELHRAPTLLNLRVRVAPGVAYTCNDALPDSPVSPPLYYTRPLHFPGCPNSERHYLPGSTSAMIFFCSSVHGSFSTAQLVSLYRSALFDEADALWMRRGSANTIVEQGTARSNFLYNLALGRGN